MKYLKKKSFLITALVFLITCFVSGYLVYLNFKENNPSASAAPVCGDNNIAGFAWSDNIGWVSFNSGDCDKNNNGYVDKSEIPNVDSAGEVGETSSIAIGSDGMPIISYYDRTNEDLKFIKCGNLSCTKGNLMQVLDSGDDRGYSSSVAIGSDGFPVISYFDQWSSGGPSSNFLFIKCNSFDCSIRNNPVFINGGNTAWMFGRWLAINNNGKPIMAYRRSDGMYFTICGNESCQSGNQSYNLNIPTSLFNNGFGVNLSIDSSNIPTITNTATGGNGKLRLVRCGNQDCSAGNNTNVVSDYMADYPAASLDHAMTIGSDEKPMIVYYRASTRQLRYTKCNDLTCSTRTSETVLDSFSDNGGGTDWKESLSIAKGFDGFAIISYYDYTTTKQDLKFVKCNNAECTDRIITTIDSGGDVGLFSSTAIGSDGFPIISYYDLTNGNLKVAKCLNADCTSVFKDGCGGNDDATTPIIPYGVKIDWPTGNFSGYAWSSNVGWVSFNRKTCNGGADNGKGCIQASDCDGSVPCELTGPGAAGVPPGPPYDGSEDFIANYNSGTGAVTGWAKTLSLGDDGWIKLSDASWSNGVTINGTSKEFKGWAWNGNDVANTGIGWISFSHLNCDTNGNGIMETGEGSTGCPAAGTAIADYKVYITNTAPTAINLRAPNINYQQACSSRDARRVQLTWQFSDPDEAACGDYESAYQIIMDTISYTTQAELEALVDNGRGDGWPFKTPKTSVPSPPTPVESFFPTDNIIHRNATLEYDRHYYWWAKVWDKFGEDSGWVQYNSAADTDNDDGNNLTFWTYKHEFPEPYFYWFPLEPSEGENVSFWDGSYYYLYDTPQSDKGPYLCFENGVQNCTAFNWTGSNPATQILSPTASSTVIIFDPAKQSQDITLQATDPTEYYCATSTTFWAKVKLPTWKEVKYK
jgi:hypothetical protein